jgi:hypothetical protein
MNPMVKVQRAAADLVALQRFEQALKLPSPKPSSALRWMNSKNTGPSSVWREDLQQQARLARRSGSVLPSSRMPRVCSSATGRPWPGRRSSSIS